MLTFLDWITTTDAAARLRLLEGAEYFEPASYNKVFEGELEKLLARLPDNEARQQVAAMNGFDWGNYVARSLLRAGFRDDDQQEAFHAIVVKLLVKPGRLFAGWEPGRHGPLDRRFRAAVWNAIRNTLEKSRNRRKLIALADPSVMAAQHMGRQPYSDSIDQFRQLVGQKLGRLALAILDQRLRGEDTIDLVGKAEIGTPSAFLLKREVQAVKDLARVFADRHGDPAFARMLARAMEAEAETVARRKAATAARHAS